MTEVTTKRTIKIGETIAVVTEPVPVEPIIVEAIVEIRAWSGVMCLTLASFANAGSSGGEPEARVNCRLRIPLPMLMGLRQIVDDFITEQMPGKEKAN